MNVGSPDEAYELSFLPNDGVGLAREEFIVSEYIRIHPMALVYFDKVKDAKIRRLIQELTAGYLKKKRLFCGQAGDGRSDHCRGILSTRRHSPF